MYRHACTEFQVNDILLRPGKVSPAEWRGIYRGAGVRLDPVCLPVVERSAAAVAEIVAKGAPVYGINTGFGKLARVQIAVDDLERLQQNLAISVPTLSQIAAQAAFDGRAEMEAVKHGYEENRRILTEGLPTAGLDTFFPVDGAFYLYADVSRFTNDSFDFAQRMLAETHVAATPGVDFDPLQGGHFIRFCYAGAAAEMHEAVERITTWLKS